MGLKKRIQVVSRELNEFVEAKKKASYYKNLYDVSGEHRMYFLGSADYSNIGDLAISEAIKDFHKRYFSEYVLVDVPLNCFFESFFALKQVIHKNDVIILQGGGNLGNLYSLTEKNRRMVISAFKDNRIILFPQTCLFTNDEKGKKEFKKTYTIYSRNPNLILLSREERTQKIFDKYFANRSHMYPDIVFNYNVAHMDNVYREGILTCFRADKETDLDTKEKKRIIELAKSMGIVREIDNITEEKDIFLNRRRIVDNQLKKISQCSLLITDRLHGMIFAAITGTPCIVFGNSNHKIRSIYNLLRELPYITFCTCEDNIKDKIQEMLELKEHSFNGYFNSDFANMAKFIAE